MNLLRHFSIRTGMLALAILLGLAVIPVPSGAEVTEVRIAKQFGLAYLPLIVMEEQKLVEAHARRAGLGEIKTSWPTFGGGSSTNDALISSAVDFSSSGVAPLIVLWAKTHGEFKGVAAVNSLPMYLNTRNPAVKSIKDFTAKDRIALPAVKVSIQAIVLQMAVAKAFGQGNYAKLDSLTVAMKHPDAMAALLSGRSEVTAHFTTPPYMYRELDDKRVHKVLDSYDVLGGPHTQTLVAASKTFRQKNPRIFAAFLAALEEANAFIAKNKREAAKIYLKSTKSKESLESILSELDHPSVVYSTTPVRITKFSDFMFRTGSIKVKADSWKDLFFENIHHKKGS